MFVTRTTSKTKHTRPPHQVTQLFEQRAARGAAAAQWRNVAQALGLGRMVLTER